MGNLDLFFHPRAVAIIGATSTVGKGGYNIIENMLQWPGGEVFFVNPRYSEIKGKTCYPSVADIEAEVDMAIIFVAASLVPDAIRSCGEKGIKAVIIESAGFNEVGEEGARLLAECLAVAKEHGVRIWGPNCIGIVDAYSGLCTTFIRFGDIFSILKRGNVSLIAQSGTMAGGYLYKCIYDGLFGASRACSIGNKVDVDECDILEALEEDPHTEVILMYLEAINEGERFLRLARRIGARKKLILLKSARQPQAHKAAIGHTGSMAGSWKVLSGALASAPVALAYSFHEMARIAKGFCLVPRPAPEKELAIFTITGAAGIVSVDLMSDHGLKLAQFTPETLEALKNINPPWMPVSNPYDAWPAIEKSGLKKTLNSSAEAILRDPNVGGLLLLPFIPENFEEEIEAPFLQGLVQKYNKPVFSWKFGHYKLFEEFDKSLQSHGIPAYDDIQDCVALWRALKEIAI